MPHPFSIVLVFGIILLFAWLTARTWRARRAFVKWPGTVIGGLLAMVGLLVGLFATIGYYGCIARTTGRRPPSRCVPRLYRFNIAMPG